MSKDLTVCELFAGVGGFTLGLKKSGWRTVYANQFEPSTKRQHAAECYSKNFPDINFDNTDINKVDYKKIPKHTLLVGGFPCQDYSVATSQAKGLQGKKGVLWWNIYDIVKVKKPKYLLLENVDRLLNSPSKQRGRDFAVILACLRDENYSVEWRMINAADYGFPQKRRRVFIFACKDTTNFGKKMNKEQGEDWILKSGFFAKDFPVKIKSFDTGIQNELFSFNSQSIKEVSDTYSTPFSKSGFMTSEGIFNFSVEPIFKMKKKFLKDVLVKKVEEKYYINEDEIGEPNPYKQRVYKSKIPKEILKSWNYVKGAKHEIRETQAGHQFNYDEGGIPFPDNLNSASRTMLTSEGSKSPNRISHIIKDPNSERYRVLTPVECEKLNGFPKNWTKLNDIPDSKRYFFMGNALVVGLIKKMGKRLTEII